MSSDRGKGGSVECRASTMCDLVYVAHRVPALADQIFQHGDPAPAGRIAASIFTHMLVACVRKAQRYDFKKGNLRRDLADLDGRRIYVTRDFASCTAWNPTPPKSFSLLKYLEASLVTRSNFLFQ